MGRNGPMRYRWQTMQQMAIFGIFVADFALAWKSNGSTALFNFIPHPERHINFKNWGLVSSADSTGNCMLIFTNYLNLDIENVNWPAIIRNPKPIKDDVGFWRSSLRGQFNLTKVSSRSRPWNFEIQIHLFPFRRIWWTEEPIFDCIWSSGLWIKSYQPIWEHYDEYYYPGSRPVLVILAVPDFTGNTNVQKVGTEILKGWSQIHFNLQTYLQPKNPLNYEFLLSYFQKGTTGNKSFQLSSIFYFTFERGTKNAKRYHTEIRKLEIDLQSDSFLSHFELVSAEANREIEMAFEIVDREKSSSVSFKNCNYKNEREILGAKLISIDADSDFKAEELADMFEEISIHLWRSLMKNHSYLVSILGEVDRHQDYAEYLICRNGVSEIELRKSPYIAHTGLIINWVGGSYHRERALHIPATVKSLRFVSCGYRGTAPLAFLDLVNIFDLYVWICILVSIIAFVGIWHLLSIKLADLTLTGGCQSTWVNSITHKTLFIWNVILEHGYSTPSSSFPEHFGVQILLGTYLLMMVIISNGYKNDNITNMIVPRKRLLYKEFEDLVSDNSTVYTPISQEMSYLLYSILYNKVNDIRYSSHQIRAAEESFYNYGFKKWQSRFNFHLRSVPEKMRENYFNDHLHYTEDERKMNVLVYNNSRLHPKVLLAELTELVNDKYPYVLNASYYTIPKYFEEYRREFLKLGISSDGKQEPTTMFLLKHYHRLGIRELYTTLAKCDKSAVIVPSHEALEWAKKLGRPEVSVGRKTYFLEGIATDIFGQISGSLIVRLGGLKESGIVKRWLELLEVVSTIKANSGSGEINPEAGSNAKKSSTMYGNVVVVFAVLVSGIGLAVITFALEVFIRMKCSKILEIFRRRTWSEFGKLRGENGHFGVALLSSKSAAENQASRTERKVASKIFYPCPNMVPVGM